LNILPGIRNNFELNEGAQSIDLVQVNPSLLTKVYGPLLPNNSPNAQVPFCESVVIAP